MVEDRLKELHKISCKKARDLHFVQILGRAHSHLVHDSRVLRTASRLSDHGYSNSILIYGDQESPESYVIGDRVVKVARVKSTFPFLNAMNPYSSRQKAKYRNGLNYPIMRKISDRFFRYASFRSMLSAVLQERPDVIWANDYDALEVGVAAKVFSSSRPMLVYDSHEFWSGSRIFLGPKRIFRPLIRNSERYFVNRYVDFVVSVNTEIADLISYGKPSYVIHNIPDCPSVDYEPHYFHKRYSLPIDSKVMLYLGSFNTGRGIEFLLRLSSHLQRNIKIVFMGYGPLESYMVSHIRQNSLSDRCFIHHAVLPCEVMRYIPAADLGLCLIEPICTSYYYSLPNKFWEYLMSGIPLITSELPSMSKLVHKYQLGTTVDVGDLTPNGFYHALQRLLADYDTYKASVISYRSQLLNQSEQQYLVLLRDLIDAYCMLDQAAHISPSRHTDAVHRY